MRVLVTGSLGYIGPVLVAAVQHAGHEVVGLDSGLFVDALLEPGPAIPVISRDVRDVTVDDLRGFGAVLHLAALSNDPLGSLNPALTHQINAAAAVRLAAMARDAGVRRFVFSSSCSVYGAAAEPWVDESSACHPVTPYGESKLAAERGLAALSDTAFCVVSLRNATAFGYSPNLRTDLVVNDFVAGACLHKQIRLNSNGSAWRPLVHVQDIARAFVMAMEAPAEVANGAVVNVGAGDQNYTVLEMAQAVAALVPGAHLSVAPGAGADRRSYRVRFERVQQLLPDFRCRFDLRSGVIDLLSNLHRLRFRSTVGHARLTHLQQLLQDDRLDAALRLREGRPATA